MLSGPARTPIGGPPERTTGLTVGEPSTEDVLRWEARQGPRAAIAAACRPCS